MTVAIIDYGSGNLRSAQRALERVMEARDRGLPAYAETCPQYLFLDEDALRGTPDDPFQGAKYVCTPPLRPKSFQEHLWRGLRDYDHARLTSLESLMAAGREALGILEA